MPDEVTIRPYSLKELSVMYGVSKNTFKKWLEPFSEKLGERNGYYYNIQQVRFIFKKLGIPGETYRRPPRRSDKN